VQAVVGGVVERMQARDLFAAARADAARSAGLAQPPR